MLEGTLKVLEGNYLPILLSFILELMMNNSTTSFISWGSDSFKW
jgi:hypothetical protein